MIEISVLNLLNAPTKAERLAKLLAQAGVHCGILPTEGRVGGGSVPNRSLPSYAVAFGGDVNALEEKLRSGVTPIVGRIHEGKYLLDVRTLMEKDFDTIAEAVREALA